MSSRQELRIKYVADWLINPGIDWDAEGDSINTPQLCLWITLSIPKHKKRQ